MVYLIKYHTIKSSFFEINIVRYPGHQGQNHHRFPESDPEDIFFNGIKGIFPMASKTEFISINTAAKLHYTEPQ